MIHTNQKQPIIINLYGLLIKVLNQFRLSQLFYKIITSKKIMQNQSQTPTHSNTDPFTILHNFRNKPKQRQKPKRKSSVCQRHNQIPEFTMRTRKMTAEIELKHELQMHENAEMQDWIEQLNPEREMKLDEDEQFLLVNEQQLQNMIPLSVQVQIPLSVQVQIPLSVQVQKQMVYNYGESSQIQSYCKLQRALFDFNLQGSMQIE